jgi:hypothetical protein
MSMFPPFTTGEYLDSVPKTFGDIKAAVCQSSEGRFTKGQCWAFWMEDDPRQANGILHLAKYRCYEPGGFSDSKWELVQ